MASMPSAFHCARKAFSYFSFSAESWIACQCFLSCTCSPKKGKEEERWREPAHTYLLPLRNLEKVFFLADDHALDQRLADDRAVVSATLPAVRHDGLDPQPQAFFVQLGVPLDD